MEKAEVVITQEEKNQFLGIDSIKAHPDANNWTKCVYCEKFHHKKFFPKDVGYCVHCWAWLNSHEYEIELGVYTGNHSIESILEVVKIAYPIHLDVKCTNHECLFDKIKKYHEIKKLHISLIEALELNKKPKQIAVSFNSKNKALDVDYEKSYIVM
jgi:hypothetical protein